MNNSFPGTMTLPTNVPRVTIVAPLLAVIFNFFGRPNINFYAQLFITVYSYANTDFKSFSEFFLCARFVTCINDLLNLYAAHEGYELSTDKS